MKDIVQASLPQGTLSGIRDQGVCRFSAIPYAEAPVGPLRFAPPRPAQWRGERDATQPGPVCPQLTSRLARVMGDFEAPQSEDCLHLTVWTPGVDAQRRPVVVWLHGGAWQSGAGALDWYDGARLARRGDIVVVAVNYRLAGLGWLCLPGETANVGLLDEEAAIAWVHAHVEAFGGDPQRITVMGQSAGASNIALMLTRKPLFQRAIMQSAGLGRGFRDAEQAAHLSRVFLRAAGADSLAAARELPVQALLDAQLAPDVVAALQAEGANRSLFYPAIDGDVVTRDIDAAMTAAAGRADVMIGYTRDEFAAFPGGGLDEDSRRKGDRTFALRSRQWARDAVDRGRQAWEYRFDAGYSREFGACHCVDLPFVFDTFDAFQGAPMLEGLAPAQARRISGDVQTAWIAFIRGGSPGWDVAPAQHLFA
ncbi:carboxylesterase/lipase family protein [Achromobacter aloeverae]|uniref:Carboxylic ester hydrolase n=1 Tax=Achromobacter aloeverae TaxID=1750518 RepID=A0A4Q1HJX6_9BURK|nr:carboxylesterase family protein [Achromobacter aloeverae]RXN90414.1 carboxylesterase/lipase family protein [Achromobacter aloeverae]